MTQPMKVLVALDAQLLRDALSTRLGVENDLCILGVPGDEATLMREVGQFEPAVVVMDADEHEDGSLWLSENWRTGALPPLVALISSQQVGEAPKLLFAGASAVVIKTASSDELVSAVRWAACGADFVSPPLLRPMLAQLEQGHGRSDSGVRKLSPREREVLQLMVEGLNRKQIASELHLAIDTVRAHLRTIMEKMEAHSATAVVSAALAAGLRPRRQL